jgi:hypothetical protein
MSDSRDMVACHWILMCNPPAEKGIHWLLSRNRFRILGCYDGEGRWKGLTVHGTTFDLLDEYSHWSPIREPAVYD